MVDRGGSGILRIHHFVILTMLTFTFCCFSFLFFWCWGRMGIVLLLVFIIALELAITDLVAVLAAAK
jgi:hypothetical protein